MRRFLPLLFAVAAATAFPFTFSSSPTIEVEAAALGGLASLSVRSDVRGAAVWLDYQARGSVPLDMTGLAPGSHLLVLRKDGYYDAVIMLSLAADTITTVTSTLEPRTGFLDVRTDPPGATVIVDGESHSPGVIEVPAGRRDVVVRAFGYRDESYSVFVPEKAYASVTATLDRAPFEASGFRLSRTRFNPRNAGLRGQVRASFSVTARGYAEAVVTGPDGSVLRRFELGPFDDWDQAFSWDGKSDDLELAADGTYSIHLELRPEAGLEAVRDRYDFDATVMVDSTIVMTPSGAYGGIPGSVHAPEALAPASDGLRIDATGSAAGSTDGSGTVSGAGSLSASVSIEGVLDAGIGLELSSAGLDAVRLGLRVSAPLAAPLGLALVADGRISDSAAGNPAWARLGPALGLGTPFANVVVAPHVGAYWEDGLSVRAGLGAAVNLGGYSLGASLSASAGTAPLSGGFSVEWPVGTTLELRAAPPGLPLSVRILGGLDWSPAPTGWSLGLGISGSF